MTHLPQVIGLSNLRTILRGSVKIKNNINLCYVHTVDWAAIVQDPDDNVLKVCMVPPEHISENSSLQCLFILSHFQYYLARTLWLWGS